MRWRDIEAAHASYLPVAEAKVSYKQPARYDDVTQASVHCLLVGGDDGAVAAGPRALATKGRPARR